MNEEEFFSKSSGAQSVSVGSINTALDNGKLYTTEKTAVRTPLEYQDDYFITVRASEIKKARQILLDNRKVDSKMFDILLAATFMFFGAYIGTAISMGVLFDSTSFKTILGTIIAPLFGVGCAVGTYFTRKESKVEKDKMIDDVLDNLIGPSKTEKG